MKKILIVLLALIVLIAAGIGIFIATFDINRFHPQIEAFLQKKLQRDVTFANDMEFHLRPNPTIKIKNIHIGNPADAAWVKSPYLLEAKEFNLEVAMTPLLNKQIVINGIIINGATVNLESQNGKTNYDFKPAAQTADVANVKTEPKANPASAALPIEVSKVSVTDSVINKIADGKTSSYTLKKVDLALPESGNSQIDFDVLLDKMPISGKLETGTIADWSSKDQSKAFNVGGTLHYGDFDIDLKSAITGRQPIEKVDADFAVKAQDGLSTKGTVSADVKDMQNIKAVLHVTELVLANGAAPAQNSTAPNSGSPAGTDKNSGRVIPDTALPRNLLPAQNAVIDLKIDSIKKADAVFDPLSGIFTLNKGVIDGRNIKISFKGSAFDIGFSYNSVAAAPRLAFSVRSDKFDYGTLLKQMCTTGKITGIGALNVALNGSGINLREWAAGSSGNFGFTSGQGTFDQKFLRSVGADVFSILQPGTSGSDIVAISCGIINAKGQNGVYAVQPIALNTNILPLIGKGTINLQNETLNILMSPQKGSSKLSQLAPSARIAGTLAKPAISADQQSLVSSVSALAGKNEKLKSQIESIGSLFGKITGRPNAAPENMNDPALENSCVPLPKATPVAATPEPTAIAPAGATPTDGTAIQPTAPAQKKKFNAVNLLNAIGNR